MKTKHYGQIKKGVFKLDNRDAFFSEVASFTDQRAYITFSTDKPSRSLNQNNYYWGVVIEKLSEKLGYTKDEMHDILKFKFLGVREIEFSTDVALPIEKIISVCITFSY